MEKERLIGRSHTVTACVLHYTLDATLFAAVFTDIHRVLLCDQALFTALEVLAIGAKDLNISCNSCRQGSEPCGWAGHLGEKV